MSSMSVTFISCFVCVCVDWRPHRNLPFALAQAPVPFLVGTHSDCLKQAAGRTSGVVFVDLDHNRCVWLRPLMRVVVS